MKFWLWLAVALLVVNILAVVIRYALGVPKTFAPLQPFTLNIGVISGYLLSQLVFFGLRRMNWPVSMMVIVAGSLWVLSIALPMRIYEKRGTYGSDRFDGITLSVVAAMATIHLVVASASVVSAIAQRDLASS